VTQFKKVAPFIAVASILAFVAPALAQVSKNTRLPHHVTPWRPVTPGRPAQAPSEPFSLSTTTWSHLGPGPLASGSGNFNVSGRITAIAAHPTDANTIYIAAAGGGVWKTTNGGTSWTPLTDAQKTLSMGAIAVARSNPNVIYAGTGEANNSLDSNYGRGILISSDGGTTWHLSTAGGAFDRLTTAQIAVDPTNPQIAYVAMADFGYNGLCCTNTGIWKTTDQGVTWTNTTISITQGAPYSDVQIDPTSPNTVYMAIGNPFFGSIDQAKNGVYKSNDGGTTWTLLLNAPNGASTGRFAIGISGSNPQVVYVSTSDPSFYSVASVVRSQDGGSTFTSITPANNYTGPQGWYDTTVIVDPSNSAVVYVAGQDSILRTANNGASWTDISAGAVSPFTSPHVDHHGVAFDANGKLLDGDDGGIYRLENPMAPSWSDLNGNLETIQFQGIGLHPTDINKAIGGSQDNGTELFTGSALWTETDGGDGGFAKFSPTDGSRAYHQIPVASFGTNFFRRSDDGGNTWVTKTSNIFSDTTQKFYAPFVIDPGNGNRVLYGTTRVWETVDGGDSWSTISNVGVNGWNPAGAHVDSIGLAPSDMNTIYASANGQIFFTSNHGASWTDRSVPGVLVFGDLEVDPVNNLIAYAVVSGFSTSGNVFRTTDGGTTWTNITSNLPSEPVWSLQIDGTTSPTTLYIGADDGVYASTNLGTSWSRFGLGFPDAQVFEVALNTHLHVLGAATHGRGMWEIMTPTTPSQPTVSSVSPNAGPTAGGNMVTINGTNFLSGATVNFGTTASATVTFVSATQLQAVAPAHASGTVDVTVTTPGGTSALSSADHYTYDAQPTVSSVSPNAGPTAGGNTVTINGTNFVPGATVKFGALASPSVTFVSATQLKAVAPAHASGTVDVTVTTPGGMSGLVTGDHYTYGPPMVSSFTLTSGITGSTVTINGTNFVPGATVKFGALASPSVTFVSGTQIKAVVPNGAVTAKISVTTPAGTGTSASNFTVTLSVTGFSPSSGPTGTVVTITGVGFNSSSTVKFNGTAASSVTHVSSTQLKATVPSTATTGPIIVTNTTAPTGTVRSAVNYTKTLGRGCVQNLAIGAFTLCGEVYNDVSTGTNVQVNYSPSPNNGIIAWATWCFMSGCKSSISGVTATIGDNINATESCFVGSPHSPFITNANGGAEGSGDFQQHYVWYCPSIPSGVTSFTVTPSNPNLRSLQLNISEWKAGSLAASCSPISACFEDVDSFGQAGNSTGGTTATITTSGSTVNANDLIFAVTEVPCCSFTARPGTGYIGITVAPSLTVGMVSEAKAETTTGIKTATTTWTGGSTPWFGVIVPLKGAGASATSGSVARVLGSR
jgi:IPT/TIG domain/Sortilin, neurotensin receptor 3,